MSKAMLPSLRTFNDMARAPAAWPSRRV